MIHKVEVLRERAAPSRTAQALCVITACVAFVLGTLVGVLIPLYILPPLMRPAAPDKQSALWPEPAGAAGRPALLQPGSSAEQLVLTERLQLSPASTATVMPDMERLSSSWGGWSLENATDAEEQAVRRADGDSWRDAASLQYVVDATDPEDNRLEDGIFWSTRVEATLPTGISDQEVTEWRRFVRHTPLQRLEGGCGRMQNRLVTFENGTQSCCRYRQNLDQIQGELFSFLLSRRLGISSLPATTVQLVRPADWRWAGVRAQLSAAQWADGRPLVLTKFRPQLTSAYIPQQLRGTERRLHPAEVRAAAADTLPELAQWSDLIVFDYLTANLDRVVNNLYNQQWNAAMMEAPAHNLARDADTGLLLFLDNESGLLHGYRLLDKYEPYHRALLDATCVFRRATAEAVARLHASRDVGAQLRRAFKAEHADVADVLPTLPERSIRILQQRIDHVHQVIERCRRTYSS